MDDYYDWKNLPIELLKLFAERVRYLVDFMSFTTVCKSWSSAASELTNDVKPWLPFQNQPWLLLAEETGSDVSSIKIGYLDALSEKRSLYTGRVFRDDQAREFDRIIDSSIDNLFKNTSSTRGLFSLATDKTYNLDLPEATDKLILGANQGWLLTLGRDLEINLLHPLLREQIPLPGMLALPSHEDYDDDTFPQKYYTSFITKAVLSSDVPRKGALQHLDTTHLPLIMVIYGLHNTLSFARLGDKTWTDVQASSSSSSDCWFHDIVYHKGKFYAIESTGGIFICDIENDDKQERQYKAIQITSAPIEIKKNFRSYIVESASGSHIWVLLRFMQGAFYDIPAKCGDFWYNTIDFKIFKFEQRYCNCDEAIPTCTCKVLEEVNDLGNEALFIGRGSSKSVASSKFIQPNSIYFTDDTEYLWDEKGSHDMGIFNVKTREIQPHFKGMSIHPFSPALWYI